MSESRPLRFALDPARPNPFNPTTVLTYYLTTDGPVSVMIYDQIGQRIRTLVDGTQPTGRHTVTWNGTDDLGRNMASGVYIVRLKSDEGALVRRLVLVR